MADDVEMIPVDASEPPKANPLAVPAAPKVSTLKLSPMVRKPVPGGTQTAALKPGLRLPTKPGLPTGLKLPPKPGLTTAGLKLPPKPATVTASLKPGLKLPTVAMKPGVKLPPKPGAPIAAEKPVTEPAPEATAVSASAPAPAPAAPAPAAPAVPAPAAPAPAVPAPAAPAVPAPAAPAPAVPVAPATAGFKPGLKLPTASMKPGIKLPPKPVIRKPGATVTAAPLPKPVTPLAAAKPTEASVASAAPAAKSAVAASVPPAKPVAVDAQGVGKLPTVAAKAVDRADAAPTVSANPNPLEALKSVTQKLKGLTQEIPQQAILRKTGIIAEGAMSEAQKEAAKHKTARISLSDAMGVAPVKNENAPMKTIRIKRPVDISGISKPTAPAATPSAAPAETMATLAPEDPPTLETLAPVAPPVSAPASTVTQRKTLKITRPGGAVRPSGKFGVKRPSQATTIAKTPADKPGEPPAEGENAPVAEIADIPEMPAVPVAPIASAKEESGIGTVFAMIAQIAACVAMGVLAWMLYQNTQTAYF